jgi:hypothetical protein
VYETPTPFLLTDVSLSWFYGTTPPACLNLLSTDTEIEKKDKLMNKICSIDTALAATNVTVAANAPGQYTDISGAVTAGVGITIVRNDVRLYNDNTVYVSMLLNFSGSKAADFTLASGLPSNTGEPVVMFLAFEYGGGNFNRPLCLNFNDIRVGATATDAASATMQFTFMYKTT